MRYRINQIKLKPGQSKNVLGRAIRNALGRKDLEISRLEIVKESIDARKKPNVKLIYTVDFDCEERLNLPEATKKEYVQPYEAGTFAKYSGARPIVVGYGPAGMFAALCLASWGLKPIVLERGQAVDERVASVEEFWQTGKLNTESNVQFGEGGAGTFSDGKLTTNVKDPRIAWVLEQFVKAGADEDILYVQKPHIGTDMLRGIVKNIRIETEKLGGEFRFSTRLDGINLDSDGKLSSVTVHDNMTGIDSEIEASKVILATGHSAADTFAMLLDKGMIMEQKPFSIGVRIEHPQEMIDETQYGDAALAEHLGHAIYKLNHKCSNGRGVYTFCMCPGGQVVNSSSEEGTVVTNGMSNSGRDSGIANSGLLVDVRTDDFPSSHPLAGIEFQRMYEKKAYEASRGGADMPRTTYGSFKAKEDDIVRSCLPKFAGDAIVEAMPHLGRKLKGFDREDSIMTGVETRSSSPVRIYRDENGNSSIAGIFPAGEGPGYAGGIMSAAVDGIKTAEKLALQIEGELNR
ncbi:MAG: NAD(FAD)-utilizing dehydrogenase [Eubacterium sp.]|nr:NAD(FAD)-utilizing dehydrogenase [Candidatus Colimonas fimequi]